MGLGIFFVNFLWRIAEYNYYIKGGFLYGRVV